MPGKPKPKTRAERRAKFEQWQDRFRNWWKKSEGKWFAMGYYARVFRKKNANYPHTSFFFKKGEIVKVETLSVWSPNLSKYRFWEQKLIHELFPDITPAIKSSVYHKSPPRMEMHYEEVPIHKELKAYQDLLARESREGHAWHSKEYLACIQKQREHTTEIKRHSSALDYAGIDWGSENATNVSLAKPKKPIFLDVNINFNSHLKQYIEELPEPQRKKAQKNLARYTYWRAELKAKYG